VQTAATTRAVIEELLRRMGEGSPESIAELYAQESDWLLDWPEAEHGRPATPWIRHRSTRAEVVEHYRQLIDYHVPEQAATTVDEVLIDGDDGVVFGTIRQTARSTGRPYSAAFALRLTVRNGRIVRNHVYEDSLAVAQAFEADPDHLRHGTSPLANI